MDDAKATAALRSTMQSINDCWLENRPEAVVRWLSPGFVSAGRELAGDEPAGAWIEALVEFCRHSTVIEFTTEDWYVRAASPGIVSYRYTLLYERGGVRREASGRDLWLFAPEGEGWRAVWRTMLDLEEAEVVR